MVTALTVWKLKDVARAIYLGSTTERIREKHHKQLLVFFEALKRESLFNLYKRTINNWVLSVDLYGHNPPSTSPWKWSAETFAVCILITSHYVFFLITWADLIFLQNFLTTHVKTGALAFLLHFTIRIVMSVCYVILWDTLFYFAFTKSLTLRKALRLGIPLLVLSLIMPVLDIENAQIAFVALGSGLIALLWTRHLGSKAILIFFVSAICVVAAIYADDYFRPSKLMMDPEFADYLQAKRVPLRNAILYYLFIVSFYDWAALNIAQLFLVRASAESRQVAGNTVLFVCGCVGRLICLYHCGFYRRSNNKGVTRDFPGIWQGLARTRARRALSRS